jgi:hypothetical protein
VRPNTTRITLDRTWLRAAAPAPFRGRPVGAVHRGLSAEVLEEIANDRRSYLEQHRGTRFDPGCVDAFLEARSDAEEIRAAFPDAGGEGRQQRQGFGRSAAAADGL